MSLQPLDTEQLRIETINVQTEADVVLTRKLIRKWAVEMRFSLVDQTKLVTAASELARNLLVYGKGGAVWLDRLRRASQNGLRVQFVDQGPGIADIELALRDGFTTGKGMGLGLGGAKRLVNEFEIESSPGAGTRVAITRWK